MQKRKGFGRKVKEDLPKESIEASSILNSVSKSKLIKEGIVPDQATKTNKQKHSNNPTKSNRKTDDERLKLIEKKKQYTEQIRKINKEKFKRSKTQNGSAEKINTDIKCMKQEPNNRSKSEEGRGKTNKHSRKFNRAKMRLDNHNINNSLGLMIRKNNFVNSITIDEDGNKDCNLHFKEIEQQDGLSTIKFKCDDDKIAINLNLLESMRKCFKEVIKLNHIDNSDQKTSIEDDGKCIKTPELNMGEKYSHKCSDNKLSAHSTEKESKKTNRFLSSQKKKFVKVAKEIQECKRDLIKMQKLSELRKLKNVEESDFDKECKRRKQNLESLNLLIKKRNLNLKHKKRNQEKLIKKDLINFECSMGLSLSKKSKKIKNFTKGMKRNQTFSRLSSKGQNETINTSINEIATEKKKNLIRLNCEFKLNKELNNKSEASVSMLHSPSTKQNFSSNKKKQYSVSNTKKKLSKKKINDSIQTDSSRKINSVQKTKQNICNIDFVNPKRGYANAYKKKQTIQLETKRSKAANYNEFNDISEIQEFNITDEESLINSSILKNIDEHESAKKKILKLDSKNNKAKSAIQKSKYAQITREQIKVPENPRKCSLSSVKKKNKKRKKSQNEVKQKQSEKSNKKRKVVFHISKKKSEDPSNTELKENIPDNLDGKIKKYEVSYKENKEGDKTDDEIINLRISKDNDNNVVSFNPKDPKNLEKFDIINSEKLNELLSSKKKHRYKNVVDSMNDVMSENIGHQIDFNYEEENLEIHKYESNNSKISSHHSEHDCEEDIDVRNQTDINPNNSHINSIIRENDAHEELYPIICDNTITDSESESQQSIINQELHQNYEEHMNESLIYEHEQEEHDNLAESTNGKQTVINCTQSDRHSGSDIQSENSFEYNNEDNNSIEYMEHRRSVYSNSEVLNPNCWDTASQNLDEESENEHHEIRSEYEQKTEEQINTNDDNILIEGCNEEIKYDLNSNLEDTLTNMRIVFGSEQQVRENSLKTLEKMEESCEDSQSVKKNHEKSSIFENKSFQDFSFKKFAELMQVKNMKNFQVSIQKTFREYNKAAILTMSDKKNNKTSLTPKKTEYVSPRKYGMRDLELDKFGYEQMKLKSEKKANMSNKLGSSSSQSRLYSTFVYYKPNLSLNKSKIGSQNVCPNEGLENSDEFVECKGMNPQKLFNSNINYYTNNDKYIDHPRMQNYDSPEQSNSEKSKESSCTIVNTVEKSKENSLVYCGKEQSYDYINRTPDEEENIKTVKLDSYRLRSQKRGLPIEENKENDETPKCSNNHKRVFQTEENCNTGNKYILSDCFTDEKIREMNMRNTVTSTKKMQVQQNLRDYKSPTMSSYISSAKKALEEEFDLDDRIEFQLSGEQVYKKEGLFDKENISQNKNLSGLLAKELSKDQISKIKCDRNSNILIERFREEDDRRNLEMKNYVCMDRLMVDQQDYQYLDSPSKSPHKHSKSRSRTKEKRGNSSGGNEDKTISKPDFGEFDDKTCMMIDFVSSPEPKTQNQNKELEETSKSLEWILSKIIDKKKRDDICKLEEEQKSSLYNCENERVNTDENMPEIEVEEVKRINFGNAMIRNENIGHESNKNSDSNLGQYIECLESVESSTNNSGRALAEKELLKDKDGLTEYMTDEILSMMLFNDIHDCPMHPIREANFIDYFKEKYPFNKELGIDTSQQGTLDYINGLLEYIKHNHIRTVLKQLKKPIKVDPIKELKNLQAFDDFYNDKTCESEQSENNETDDEDNGCILPNELFYEYEQIRKNEYNIQLNQLNESDCEFTESEIEDKIKYTYVHDKVVFDTLNNAMDLFSKRKETIRPWRKHKLAAHNRNFCIEDILSLFDKSQNKVNEWLSISAGTRKVPPSFYFDNCNQMNDGMNDGMYPSQMLDEERLQQLREEKLSLLLSREIQEEDYKWNEFESSEIQIKLDLTDMVLENLVCEVCDILSK